MDASISEPAGRRRRRKHSAEFKAKLVKACQQPGVSSAAIALANGLNANMLRRWVNDAEHPQVDLASFGSPSTESVPGPAFVPLQLPAPAPQADIRIELQRGGLSASITWPAQAVAECAAWMRECWRRPETEPAQFYFGADKLGAADPQSSLIGLGELFTIKTHALPPSRRKQKAVS